MAFRTRFAPSPTGHLHLGHALSAAIVRRAADTAGGEALLRIEDTDLSRCRPHFTTAILEDLDWLGLSWDGPVRHQSAHFDDYGQTVDALRARGLVYRCFLTRQEAAARFPDGRVRSGPLPAREEAAALEQAMSFAWRLSLERARAALGPLRHDRLSFTLETDEGLRPVPARPELHGDIALTRKDSPAAYHLAACHDDALQEISHVIRGEDLAEAAHIHTLLQALMDWPQPVYRHHRLVLETDGQKLSKRTGSKSLAALRAEGLSPAQVFALAGL